MILVDAGPLIALLKPDDQHHAECTATFRSLAQPFGTVWPVLAEASYLLRNLHGAQDKVLEMIVRGAVELLPLGLDDIPRIRELMRQYADRPMDLADAALIRVAEREGIREIFTIDRKDFSVYRLHGKVRPKILP